MQPTQSRVHANKGNEVYNYSCLDVMVLSLVKKIPHQSNNNEQQYQEEHNSYHNP